MGQFSPTLRIFFIAMALSASAAQAEMMQVSGLRAGDTLNVRTGAGAGFTDIGDLQSGEVINVTGVDPSGKWGKIIYQGKAAYVSMSFLHPMTRTDGSPIGTGTFWVTGIKADDPDGGLVIRAGAGARFEAIGVLANGAAVQVIQRSSDGKWANISLGMKTGWISTAYLTEREPTPAKPKPMPNDAASKGPDGLSLPAVYSVKNVAANDVLWVRAEPTAKSTPLNALAPNAPVSVIGMANAKWARVTVGQTVGYVSAAYLKRGGGATTPDGMQLNLACRGTEPFWSVDLDADRGVVYTFVGEDEQRATLTSTSSSAITDGYPYGFIAAPLSGVIDQRMCSDGMSDVEYPWSIVLYSPNAEGEPITVEGCCTLQ